MAKLFIIDRSSAHAHISNRNSHLVDGLTFPSRIEAREYLKARVAREKRLGGYARYDARNDAALIGGFDYLTATTCWQHGTGAVECPAEADYVIPE